MVDFPNTPTEGDIWTEEGQTWVYRDGAWAVSANALDLTPVEIVEADAEAGWQVWGDVLIQWGLASNLVNGVQNVLFPKNFTGPQAPVVTATVGQISPDLPATQQYVAQVSVVNLNGFTLYQRVQDESTGTGIVSNVPTNWVAIGEAPDDLKKPKTVQAVGGTELQEYHDPTNAKSWRIVGNTLECWGAGSSDGGTGFLQVTYPKTFVGNPITSAICGGGSNGHFVHIENGTESENGATFRVRRASDDANASQGVRWRAIGEWDGVS